tara:strand:+ start:2040 stop:2303 length:264 start_codon:yes stop_codon:yes gene_type:complete
MNAPSKTNIYGNQISHATGAYCHIRTQDARPVDVASMIIILLHNLTEETKKQHTEEEQKAFVRILKELINNSLDPDTSSFITKKDTK